METYLTEPPDDDEEDNGDYQPSISGQLHVGYCTMDRACQTGLSDIVNLKETSNVLSFLGQDLASLKKSLYYAKLTLQSEYDGRLQEAVLQLHSRVNIRIAEIEHIHEERVEVVRRSFKTQLSNALCKLSNDYHKFYGDKDANSAESNKKKLEEMEQSQKALRKNELAQQEMFEMMKMQMEDVKTTAIETPSRSSSVISTSAFTNEIDHLKGTVKEFETRVEYLEDMLEETNNDNSKLNNELEVLTQKLSSEEQKTTDLLEEVSKLHEKVEQEKLNADKRLAEQKKKLKQEMENRIQITRNQMQDDSQQKLNELKKMEQEKLQKQKLEEEKRLKDLMDKHEQDTKPIEIPVDTDVGRLQIIEKKQRVEIARLQKELDRTVRMWEMKVKILQEHIHALKDEMFLRTTLQRHAAKMKQAALTYIKKGSDIIPLGVNPTSSVVKPERKHVLPSIIQAPKNFGT